MPAPLLHALLVLASYAVGAIPFGFLLPLWVKGVDVRKIGSGNVGATNASRVLGGKWFAVVFALEAAKGVLPVLFLPGLAAAPAPEWLPVACGLAAVLGHVFNPFLKFKGGKGVATAAGVIAALAPLPALATFGVFAVVLVAFRYVSLASVCAAVALAPLAFAFGAGTWVVAFGVLAGTVVVLRHRANLGRISAGTEPRVFSKRQAHGG